MLSAARAHARRDNGFTLVELLVSIVILGIIVAPLTSVVIAFLKNTDATSSRITLSHDAQISAAYFARDVASLGVRDYSVPGTTPLKRSMQTNAAASADGYTCSMPAPTALVRFLVDDWDSSTATPTLSTDVIAYYLAPPVGNVSELHRIKCAGAATPASDVVVAHNVYNGAGPSGPMQPPSVTADNPDTPQQVTLTFWVTLPSVDPYPITLNGQRRQT